jgi:hypothetical protein
MLKIGFDIRDADVRDGFSVPSNLYGNSNRQPSRAQTAKQYKLLKTQTAKQYKLLNNTKY